MAQVPRLLMLVGAATPPGRLAAAVAAAAEAVRGQAENIDVDIMNLADTPIDICDCIVAMGGSAHHYLAVDTQLRQVLGWFGALVAPTGVYLTAADFNDGALTSEAARKDLAALAETLVTLLRRLDPTAL